VCVRALLREVYLAVASNGFLFWLHYSGFQALENTHKQPGDLIKLLFLDHFP
jgi:hypothetical protein